MEKKKYMKKNILQVLLTILKPGSLIESHPPTYKEYFTYEELHQIMSKKEKIQKKNIGESKSGKEIFSHQIGKGKTRVLVYGIPHSDEIVGSLTVDYLAELIDKFPILQEAFTFQLIPCIDPDGLEMNNGWLKGKFSPMKFFLYRYHRPDEEDIDWSFPIKTNTYTFETKLPETLAILKVLKTFQPHIFSSLHSIQFAGIHFYFDKNYMQLFDKIEAFVDKKNIPLQKGKPFFIEEDWEYRPGFYRFYTTREMLNDYLRDGIPIQNLRRGEFSGAYFSRENPQGIALIPEVPLYYDKELNNLELGEKTKKQTAIASQKITLKMLDFVEPLWKQSHKHLNQRNPQFSRLKEIVTHWRKEIEEEIKLLHKKESQELATKGEIFSNEIVVEYNNCNILGTFYQLIQDSQTLSSKQKTDLSELILEKMKKIENRILSQTNIQISNLNEMISIQAFAILQTLEYHSTKKKE
ncbi:MAG: hypothetical protein ACTSX6_07800 [Candidatus Heimdallarchaeaceae archaeon]